MRVLRVVLGILTLLVAMPVLVAGAVGWWTMQHRSPDGTFRANLAPISTQDHVVVVPDVDAVLRRDTPFARADQTELRLTADPDAFVGMARPADLAAYLAGASYTEISGVSLGRGPLAVETRTITATGEPLAPPSAQAFWVRSDTGELRWTPTTDRDRDLALIVIAPPGDTTVNLSVALTAGWLTSTTWGLLILGPVLLLLGLAALAWPQRPREIVYVVDTPTAAHAGLPLPAPRSFPQTLPALPAPSFSAPPVPAPTSSASGPTSFAAAPSSRASGPSSVAADPSSVALGSASVASASASVAPAPAPAPASVAVGSSSPAAGSSSPAATGVPAAAFGVPFAGGMPSASAYFATPVSPGASVPLPTQLAFQPSLSWPPAESPTTTEPAREIPTQELPIIDPENPMPSAGVQLHLAKPQ